MAETEILIAAPKMTSQGNVKQALSVPAEPWTPWTPIFSGDFQD